MPQFFLNKRLIILLVSIIILVALIGFSLRDRDQLSWPEKFVKDTAGWVQSIVATPTQYVVGIVENIKDLQNTYEENKELKTHLEDMARLEAKVYSLEQENAELTEILEIEGSIGDYEPMQATVISRSPDRLWHEMIIVNKGSSHGVQKNMAVMTARGLIGKVKSTTPFTSTVQLLSAMDPTNRISAALQGDKKLFGTIEGYDKENEWLLLKGLPIDAEIKKDQMVVTSGLGGIFPGDVPIGKVIEVVPDQFGLNQTAYLKPEADFYNISHVMILTRGMEIPEEIKVEGEEDEGEDL
ncbi:rod shape-determining protein MreC [Mesobacillus maritimus]|uniref:rod shape-determining protein MreC n=1 Tax=Mesobacillus maritimus TaxID=1643336 RepID=UPI00203A988A|nr:rod shape-determining protein MreC [Mesobacillus maritimus]MCM3587670.1 rod shape-determining protein MreC [Mesobacillus maritimus]MCM3669915.1 rod shape-determining protein MreC [Mesobacillus maritimus]